MDIKYSKLVNSNGCWRVMIVILTVIFLEFSISLFVKTTVLINDNMLLKPRITVSHIQHLPRCHFPIICENDSSPAFQVNHTDIGQDIIHSDHPDVLQGGVWQPNDCISDTRIAIVIPYRNRPEHLKFVLRNLIPFLKIQKKSFAFFVIEQAGDTLFNRASLLNIGFLEAMKRSNYSCFIFHDVDMVPVRLCNIYECPQSGARHLGVSRNRNPPKLHYPQYMGGVLALSRTVMHRVNGFTNIMYGWGGEDDEMSARLRNLNISVERFPAKVGNYTMVKHGLDKTNPKSSRGLRVNWRNSRYYQLDGLSTVNYTNLSSQEYPLFTKITVHLDGPKTLKNAALFFKRRSKQLEKRLNEAKEKQAN